MLKINELVRLHLGVEKENLSRTIEIDMSAWAQTYPNATVEILHRRHGDQTKALVTGAEYDSETMLLSWTPTEYDTFYEGFGVAEIRMVEGEVVKKTKDLIITAVCPSVIDGSGNVVASNYQAFLNSVIGYKNDAQTAAAAAEAAAVHGPYIDNETGNWFVWYAEEEKYINTGIHAQGPPGNIDNVYATGIRMSTTDNRTVKQAMDEKADTTEVPTKTSQLTNDSGFLTSHQDISGKADKDTDAVQGNFAEFDANGNPVDSGHKASDFLTSHQDISGKANNDEIGIVVTGNKTAVGITASQGQYVIVRNSTISGKPDGLYKAAQAIPAATAIDGTYLTAVPGGLGAEVASLNSKINILGANTDAISDCNSISATGIYKAVNSTLNTPIANNHYVIYHVQYSQSEAYQMAIAVGVRLFVRTYQGTWSSWSEK